MKNYLLPEGYLSPSFKSKNKTSKYRGVSRYNNVWRVQISCNATQYYIGLYATEEEAALAYNQAAIKLYGKEAILNEVISC